MATEHTYHYTLCGLDNVWLRNGFDLNEETGAIAIHNLPELHNLIGMSLVKKTDKLSPKEIRFLRIELDMPQNTMARILGVGESAYRNWESAKRTKISETADRLLRLTYMSYVNDEECEGQSFRELIENLAQANRELSEAKLLLEETERGWSTAA